MATMMAAVEDANRDVEEFVVGQPQQSSASLAEADCEKLRQDISGLVLQIERIIKSVDASSVGPGTDLSSESDQPSLLEVIKAALHEIEDFLETPFGKNATTLFNKYSSRIGLLGLAVNFTQVTVGVFVVNLFLDVAGKLLQVNEDDFTIARMSIQNSLDFIKEKLPEIIKGIHDAGEVFRKIREMPMKDDNDLNHHLSEFKWLIKTAKLNIKHCDEMLSSSDKEVEGALRKIQAHACLNRRVRSTAMVATAAGIVYLRKKEAITTATGVVFGVFGLFLLFARTLPHYEKEKQSFMEYKLTQSDLKRRLCYFSEHLKGHEESFNEHVERK